MKQIFFLSLFISFWLLFLKYSKNKVFATLKKSLLRSLFFKVKTLPIFWIWTHKNTPDWQHSVVPVFKYRKKFKITPPYYGLYLIYAGLEPYGQM